LVQPRRAYRLVDEHQGILRSPRRGADQAEESPK
jgi:hypothetical protein